MKYADAHMLEYLNSLFDTMPHIEARESPDERLLEELLHKYSKGFMVLPGRFDFIKKYALVEGEGKEKRVLMVSQFEKILISAHAYTQDVAQKTIEEFIATTSLSNVRPAPQDFLEYVKRQRQVSDN